MFSRNSCGYCRVQWPILERFREETGWQVTQMDLERRTELGQRFGVEITPTSMVIRRERSARMVIASGFESYPNLAQTTSQAVRLILGTIRPEQFLNDHVRADGSLEQTETTRVNVGTVIVVSR